jgi:hypothetical protein
MDRYQKIGGKDGKIDLNLSKSTVLTVTVPAASKKAFSKQMNHIVIGKFTSLFRGFKKNRAVTFHKPKYVKPC